MRPMSPHGLWTRALLVTSLASSGCAPLYYDPAPRRAPTQVPAPFEGGVPPSIASAHVTQVDDPQLDGLDGVLLVFDREVDAASLHPRAFVVSRAERRPTWPREARLAPASEDDENRSVLLVGDFGDATDQGQPTHVAVTGLLFAESGAELRGLGATIEPFAVAPRVVAAQLQVAEKGRCEGAVSVVRTYWNDSLRGVEPADREGIEVHAAKGPAVRVTGFDDHSAEFGEAGQDNVLDLCLDQAAPSLQISLAAGLFRDASGHDSAAVELQVGEPQ